MRLQPQVLPVRTHAAIVGVTDATGSGKYDRASVIDRQEEEDRREKEETVTVDSIVEEDPGEEVDKEDELEG